MRLSLGYHVKLETNTETCRLIPCEKTDDTVKQSQNKWPSIYLSLPKNYIEQQNEQPNGYQDTPYTALT